MLQDKLEVLVCFDELVHILKKFLWSYTCIDLRGLYVVVTKHLADGLYRHTFFESNERCKRVPSDMHNLSKSNGK